MEQNQTILLAVIALVVIIAIVFVVTNNSGGEAKPAAVDDSSDAQNGGGSPIVPAATGNGIICDISLSNPQDGGTATGTSKLKAPDKMRMDMSMAGEGITMDITMIVNGGTSYMYVPIFGGWIESPTDELQGYDGEMLANLDSMSPSEIEALMKDTSALDPSMEGFTPTISCRSASISDSEFELPAGAEIVDMEELAAGFDTTIYDDSI